MSRLPITPIHPLNPITLTDDTCDSAKMPPPKSETVGLILNAIRNKAAEIARGQPAAAATDPATNQMIAGYRLVRRLGRGGMAQVYEANHLRLRRPVALKLLVLDDDRRELAPRFLREGRAMVQVRHQNITSILEAGAADGVHYLAMELITGGDLAKRIDRDGVIPVEEALRLMIGCCEGLTALHTAGLVHRDIKPGNIFITAAGEPKIGDFGLARKVSGADRMTVTGVSWGTPSYMAPEQIVGTADVDARADIYALGATLYTMVTGREAFSGNTAYLTTFKAMTEPFPDPRLLNPAVPISIVTIIRMATQREREHRYPSARAMREDLQRAQGEQMLLHASTVGIAPPTVGQLPLSAAHAAHAARATIRPRVLSTKSAVGGWRLLLFGGVAVAGIAWWSSDTSPAKEVTFPAWASSGGVDSAGRWVDFTVGTAVTRLRYCPAGSFTMGSPEAEAGRSANETQHHVTLSHGFWMQETECDQALYVEMMGENPSRHRGASLPVEQITWDDAQKFCAALTARGVPARLPTEAEWEYACRACSKDSFAETTPTVMGWMASGQLLNAWSEVGGGELAAQHYGDDHPDDLTLRAHPVGRRQANRVGFFDLHGNVFEWCADRWDGSAAYSRSDVVNPWSSTGEFAVVRGGSWFHPPVQARSAARSAMPSDSRHDYVGFRFIITEALHKNLP